MVVSKKVGHALVPITHAGNARADSHLSLSSRNCFTRESYPPIWRVQNSILL